MNNRITVASITSFEEFWHEVYRVCDRYDNCNTAVLYRGHSDKTYTCFPGLLRGKDELKEERSQYYKIVQDYPGEFKKNEHLSNLVKMQHYGMRTRLLDFTTNPLVALYFAVSGSKDKDGEVIIIPESRENILTHSSDKALMLACLPTLDMDTKDELRKYCLFHRDIINEQMARKNTAVTKLLHEIRGEYASFEAAIVGKHLLNSYFVFANRDNERMRCQQGLFVLFGLDGVKYAEELDRRAIRICIKSSAKKRLLKELNMMNINDETIYPGLERKAKHNINRKAGWVEL